MPRGSSSLCESLFSSAFLPADLFGEERVNICCAESLVISFGFARGVDSRVIWLCWNLFLKHTPWWFRRFTKRPCRNRSLGLLPSVLGLGQNMVIQLKLTCASRLFCWFRRMTLSRLQLLADFFWYHSILNVNLFSLLVSRSATFRKVLIENRKKIWTVHYIWNRVFLESFSHRFCTHSLILDSLACLMGPCLVHREQMWYFSPTYKQRESESSMFSSRTEKRCIFKGCFSIFDLITVCCIWSSYHGKRLKNHTKHTWRLKVWNS